MHLFYPFTKYGFLQFQSLIETCFGWYNRLSFQRKTHATGEQYIIGDADKISDLSHARIGYWLVKDFFYFYRSNAFIKCAFECDAVFGLRLWSNIGCQCYHKTGFNVQCTVFLHFFCKITKYIVQFRIGSLQSDCYVIFRYFGILLVIHSFQPCILVGLRIASDSQMWEPTIGSGAMPVFYVWSNFNHITGK